MAKPVHPALPRLTAADMRSIRRSSGLTLTELGKLIGVSERALSYWESDGRGPPWYAAALVHWINCDNTSTLVRDMRRKQHNLEPTPVT